MHEQREFNSGDSKTLRHEIAVIRASSFCLPDPTDNPEYGRHRDDIEELKPTANLLFTTCKRIYSEASSMLANTTPAVVPLCASQRLHPTSKAALTSFMRIIIM
jgi:hypothetical protein